MKQPSDQTVFASLQMAHKAGALGVSANSAQLNHPGSPVWDAVENVVPLLALLLVSGVFMVAVHVLAGIAMMVLSVLVYLTLIRPWILQRVSRRAIDAALENLHNWDLLWKDGGLIVGLTHARGIGCVSPAGDWRKFVTRHCPSGTRLAETLKSIRRSDDENEIGNEAPINMN